MQRITGLLIDPINKTSTIIHFMPTAKGFCRLLGTPLVRYTKGAAGKFHYTSIDCTAVEEDPVVFRTGWPRPLAGKVIVTGPRNSKGEHTSLTPQQIGGCRRSHRIGTLYCAGIVEWAEMGKAADALTLFERPVKHGTSYACPMPYCRYAVGGA